MDWRLTAKELDYLAARAKAAYPLDYGDLIGIICAGAQARKLVEYIEEHCLSQYEFSKHGKRSQLWQQLRKDVGLCDCEQDDH